MKNETIEVLEKNKVENNGSSCCGGAPSTNESACCKLDEDKKAEGEEGCGCNTDPNPPAGKAGKKSSCC